MPVRSLRPTPIPAGLEAAFGSPGEGPFANPWGVNVDPDPRRLLAWQMQRNPYRADKRRAYRPEVAGRAVSAYASLPEAGRTAWLGHASVLAEIDSVSVIVDPIFGAPPLLRRRAPAAWSVADLPRVDAVLITHAHYDHLDAPSVRAICARWADAVVVCPRGLASSLPKSVRNVVELSWWDAFDLRGVDIVLVPAQHWHRRRAFDTNRVLWGGYVVRGSRSLYHSGDTGYAAHFRAIGEVFPRIDVACLPAGAWEPRWFMRDQHQSPGESVQALADLGASRLFAMHWGTFDLTDEPLDFGPVALREAAERANVADRIDVLPHGGSIALGSA